MIPYRDEEETVGRHTSTHEHAAVRVHASVVRVHTCSMDVFGVLFATTSCWYPLFILNFAFQDRDLKWIDDNIPATVADT